MSKLEANLNSCFPDFSWALDMSVLIKSLVKIYCDGHIYLLIKITVFPLETDGTEGKSGGVSKPAAARF